MPWRLLLTLFLVAEEVAAELDTGSCDRQSLQKHDVTWCPERNCNQKPTCEVSDRFETQFSDST